MDSFDRSFFVSLEHLQSETKPDPNFFYNNPQVSSFLDSIPNISLSISPSLEHIHASKKNITICDIPFPPPELLRDGVLVAKFLSDDRCVHENKTCCITSESFTHPFKLELENHIDLTSLPVNETNLDSTEHLPEYISKSHSHNDNELGLVPNKFDFPTKSLNRVVHAGSLATMDNIDMRVEGPCTIETPSSESFNPLFPDSFLESATLVISSNMSYTSVNDNHEHAGGVSQSHYKIDESLMPDLFYLKYLNSQKSDCLYRQPQDVYFIDSSQLLNPWKPNIPRTQPHQIDGSNDCYFFENIFTHTSRESHSYLSFFPMKPPNSMIRLLIIQGPIRKSRQFISLQ